MALDAHYITDGPLEEFFVNKDTGLPLAGGTITFYRDSSRITAKPVYQLTGAPPNYQYIPLDNPLTLSSVGTVQNAGGDNEVIYYYPYLDNGITPDLYYVVVKDSNGVEQFTREAWPNGIIEDQIDGNSNAPVQNQISNPQFTRVFINDVPGLTPTTTTYTVSAETKTFVFAPDWNFIISGTGTVVVSRIAVAGSSTVPTSPPYVIEVTVGAGISSCYLSQRFNTNSGLWASTNNQDIFLSTALMARNELPVDTSIQMYYNASSGTATLVPIFDHDLISGESYEVFAGSSVDAIPVSDNGNSGTSGYVDIYISFQASSKVQISSIQVVPSFGVIAAPIFAYDEASANRDEALLGSYYLPRVTKSPIPSLLTAWDFPLNPAQFGASKTITAGTPGYVWDQTICNSITGNVAVTRDSVTSALTLSPASSNDSMYLIQYLTGAQAKEILYTRLSSNISAYLSASVGTVTLRAYLFRGTVASVVPILPTSLGSVAAGIFTVTEAGWEEIPRSGLDTARAQVTNSSPTVNNDIQFSGWEIVDPADIADTDKFAMVVTLQWTTAPVINVLSISLNKGDLPTRPAPQTPADVLNECQYYYEKSYNSGVTAGTVSLPGALCAQQGAHPTSNGSDADIATRTFGFTYNTPKRIAPTVVLYSPASVTPAQVYFTFSWKGAIQTGMGYPVNLPLQTGTTPDIIGWVQLNNGTFGVTYRSNSEKVIGTASNVQDGTEESYINFHYSADCRLGIIA